MAEFWNDYWWIVVGFVLMIGTGGISWHRQPDDKDSDENSSE